MKSKPQKNREPEQLAQLLAGASESANGKILTEDGRDLAAVLLGRLGGLKGGRVRAQKLSPEDRKRIAQTAARARWGEKE